MSARSLALLLVALFTAAPLRRLPRFRTRSSPRPSAAPTSRSAATSPSSSRRPPTSSSRCLPSAGSAENVQRLRYEPGVKFALVQSDVYQAFLDQAAGGNAEAGAIIRPLRVIMPLYNEEIYFIARADCAVQFRARDQGREDQRRPAAQRHRDVGDDDLPADVRHAAARCERSFLSNEEALVKLVSDKCVDVVVASPASRSSCWST